MIKKFNLIHSLPSQMIAGCVQMVNKLCFVGVLKHLHELVTVSYLEDVTLLSSQLGCFRIYQEENKHVCDKRFRGN